MMHPNSRICVTGGAGLVGTALTARLRALGYTQVSALSRASADLTDFKATLALFERERPEYVFHLAAKVYGIMGNMRNRAESFLQNVLINTHVIEAARRVEVNKIVAMGSGAVYPYPSPGLPLREDMVWMGEPHGSESSYAHAKRTMLAQLNAYRESYQLRFAFVISANLYGPNDRFDTEYGHVTPSLVRKFYEAKTRGDKVVVWGDGSAQRDFLYVEDVADALVRIMEQVEGPVNMGSGQVHAIRELVEHLADLTGLQDQVVWDSSKPNGQEYRAYDLSQLFAAGFRPKTPIREGLRQTLDWYAAHVDRLRP